MKRLLLFFIGIQGLYITAQQNAFPIATIVDSVRVKNAQTETYSLYVPSGFSKDLLSKVIFVFDPVGRGRVGVETFKLAAERYNYIVVCSNNSKNGPYEANFAIANRLFEDVFARFNIDQKRIYTAGFSGGSRLAASIAILTNQIAGVVACGAGFSQLPSPDSNFAYVGLVGDEDMNFQEMRSNQRMLDNLSIKNTLFTYSDGHNWPTQDQMIRAIAWLEIQATANGLIPLDSMFLMDEFKREYNYASKMEDAQPYEAVQEYERLLANYSSFFNLDSVKSKTRQIIALTTYKAAYQKSDEIEQSEYRLTEMFLSRFRIESVKGETSDNFEWWKRELGKLFIQESDDPYIQKLYKRLKYRLFAMAIENGNVHRGMNNWQQAIYCDRLLTIMFPKNPSWNFRLATGYAQLDNLGKTLKHLKKAVELGLEDHAQIKENPTFTRFADSKKYIRFIETLKLN